MEPKIPSFAVSLLSVKVSALDYRDLYSRYLNVASVCEVGAEVPITVREDFREGFSYLNIGTCIHF